MIGEALRALVLGAISAYQRHLSPHKGFGCAFRIHTGRRSCSAFGYRAVRRHGAVGGLLLARRRTQLCGEVHRDCRLPTGIGRWQRGDCDCDLPCDVGCDHIGRFRLPSGVGDPADWCNCCNCDWPRRDRKAREHGRPARRAGTRAESWLARRDGAG